MKKLLFMLLFSLCGCSYIETAIENRVKSAVEARVHQEVDSALASKGLDIEKIKASVDDNKDGKLSKEEILGSLKDYSKDFLLLEAHKFLKEKADASSESQSLWQKIIGVLSTILSGYLLKQIKSAKSNSQTQVRLDVMEKLLGYDPEKNIVPRLISKSKSKIMNLRRII